jgi:hypothetical protein
LVVVVQILIAQRQTVHPLGQHLLDAVLGQPGRAEIGEAAGQAPQEPHPAIHLPEQERAGIRGQRASVKTGQHRAAKMSCKLEAGLSTLCHSKEPLSLG